MTETELNILWVEDNIADILLIQEAFEKIEFNYRLHVVSDGIEAMDFLYNKGRFARAVRPDIIILDLRMPRKTGSQVVAEIRADPRLKDIPIAILSSLPAKTKQNLIRNLDPKLSIYLAKPASYSEIEELAHKIHDFWLSLQPKAEGH